MKDLKAKLIIEGTLEEINEIIRLIESKYFDKNVHGAIGIIMDDVVAGIYSGIIVVAILILFFVIFKHY